MTLLSIFEIATNSPDGIAIDAAQHKETGKWGSFMWMVRNGTYHKLMVSYDINEKFGGWDSEEQAIKEMEKVRDSAITYYNENIKK